jgi:DNA phosphorothioation-dependent restriction protein DptG
MYRWPALAEKKSPVRSTRRVLEELRDAIYGGSWEKFVRDLEGLLVRPVCRRRERILADLDEICRITGTAVSERRRFRPTPGGSS